MRPVSEREFEAHRRLLFSIAYRMLGSVAEAEDMVQEAFLRWQGAPQAEVASPKAYLSTVVTRLCIDQLRSGRAQRELYVGPWLPEPVRTDDGVDRVDAESISMAFLVLLESLSPPERAAYLLHEVFDYSHAEVAGILGKAEATCRQLYHRARQQVTARRPRFAATREQHGRLLGRFIAACSAGDLAGLTRLLAADVTAWSDSGGKARAARRPVRGADAVARLFVGLAKKGGAGLFPEITDLNGWPALILRDGDRVDSVVALETDGTRIHAVHVLRNPDKLARL